MPGNRAPRQERVLWPRAAQGGVSAVFQRRANSRDLGSPFGGPIASIKGAEKVNRYHKQDMQHMQHQINKTARERDALRDEVERLQADVDDMCHE